MEKIIKLNFLDGKKTYIIGIIMVIHAITDIAISLMNNKPISESTTTELFTGLGLITLRKGMK